MSQVNKLLALIIISSLFMSILSCKPKQETNVSINEKPPKVKTTDSAIKKEVGSRLPDSVSYRHWINQKATINYKFLPVNADITKISDGNYIGKGEKILIHADFITEESAKVLDELKEKQKSGVKLTEKEYLKAVPTINPIGIIDIQSGNHSIVANELKVLMNYNKTKAPVSYKYFQDPSRQGGYYSVVKDLKIVESKKGIFACTGNIELYYINNKGKANVIKTPAAAEVVGIDNSGGFLFRRFDRIILSETGIGTYDTKANLGTGIWLYVPGIEVEPIIFPAQAWGILNPKGNAGLFYAQVLHKESELWDFTVMPLLPNGKLQSLGERPKNKSINLANAGYFPILWTGLNSFVTAVIPDDTNLENPVRRIVKVDLNKSLIDSTQSQKVEKTKLYQTTKLLDLKPQPEESIKIGPHTIMLSPQNDAIAFLFEAFNKEKDEQSKIYLYVMGLNDGTWARFEIKDSGYGSLSLLDWRKDGKQIAISAVMVKSEAFDKKPEEISEQDLQPGILLITLK